MLESLKITNIALIKSQKIDLCRGLNVLTGETGAGKSLVVDALSLLLGEKADRSLISRGEQTASVEAVFGGLTEAVKDEMEALGLEREDTLVITRRLMADGKNDCRVNGSAFTLAMLKRLSAPLMDLHGQFEHQNLLKVANHVKILDLFGGKKIAALKEGYQKVNKEYDAVLAELDSFNGDDLERNRLLELYKYQMDEIDEANFYDGEEEELKNYRNQVLHQEKILDAVGGASKLLGGDGYEVSGTLDAVKKAGLLLGSVSQYCGELGPYIDRLENARIEIEDIAESLDGLAGDLFIDEESAKINENRLDLLSSFKKKYGPSIAAIREYREQIGREYERLNGAADRIEELKKRLSTLTIDLVGAAEQLRAARKEAALRFEASIKEELIELGMKSAAFAVTFEPLDLAHKTSAGMDKIEFMFSANLGEELKPLKAVASGGEMSRFMLAVKNITAEIEGIGTLVFDEIDTGVSGYVAGAIAQKLKKVSKKAQVICVSHLPQIASYADNHLVIEKQEKDQRTTTSVSRVDGEARVKEVARLISGNITEHALSHARELLEAGKKF